MLQDGTMRVWPEEQTYGGTVAVRTVHGGEDDYAAALQMAAATSEDSGCVGWMCMACALLTAD